MKQPKRTKILPDVEVEIKERKGATIHGQPPKGVKTLDKDSRTEEPPVEVTIGEGDRAD